MKIDWLSLFNFFLCNVVAIFIFHMFKIDSALMIWITAFLLGLIWPWPFLNKEKED